MREILVTVSAGIFGMAGAGLFTWAFGPLLRVHGGKKLSPASGAILVLIPAHDEELTLPETIRSVLECAKTAGVTARVVVGADACQDQTVRVARAAGVEVVELAFRSKWKTLAALAVAARPGDWVALVDAGAVWPAGFLRDVAPLLSDPGVLGVAPSYFPAGASALERLFWKVEAFWKRGENRAGGPVSVHGATVLYRAEALSASFTYLARFRQNTWLNDDVALPFAARITNPQMKLVYWCPGDTASRISDSGLREGAPQTGRRTRMVAGNIEWAVILFPRALLYCPGVAVVALRRLLRIFWAYWALLFGYGIGLSVFGSRGFALLALFTAAIVAALLLAGLRKRGVLDAGFASLAAPFLIWPVLRGRKRAWE
jgi:glycosyltransferase involved in cell wall biosynthesis